MEIGNSISNYSNYNINQNKQSFKGWVDMPWGFDDAPKGSKWTDVINFCWKDEAGVDPEITVYPRGKQYIEEGNSEHYQKMSELLKQRSIDLQNLSYEPENDFEKYQNASRECEQSGEKAEKKASQKKEEELLKHLGWQQLWIDLQMDKRAAKKTD